MSELQALALVARHPHPVALARRGRHGAIFPVLHRLEARGFVRRQRGCYRLTRRGRDELSLARALTAIVRRGAGLNCVDAPPIGANPSRS